MRITAFLLPTILLTLAAAAGALAHTGPLEGGEIPWDEVVFPDLDTVVTVHDETYQNPTEEYKGWWYINLTNNSGIAWAGVLITPGANDLVAIVEGNGLEDEWGFIGNSVVANKPGSFAYSIVRGTGTRDYGGGVIGNLWGQAAFTFDTPLANTQKVGFKIYTDNSYYEGPYASSFCMCLTPVPVPEPGSMLVLLSGVAGIAGFARRRR